MLSALTEILIAMSHEYKAMQIAAKLSTLKY